MNQKPESDAGPLPSIPPEAVEVGKWYLVCPLEEILLEDCDIRGPVPSPDGETK